VNREYFLEIEKGVIVFVQFNTEKGDVKDFVIKLYANTVGNGMKFLDMIVGMDVLIRIFSI
jgi:hypothetical protein